MGWLGQVETFSSLNVIVRALVDINNKGVCGLGWVRLRHFLRHFLVSTLLFKHS